MYLRAGVFVLDVLLLVLVLGLVLVLLYFERLFSAFIHEPGTTTLLHLPAFPEG